MTYREVIEALAPLAKVAGVLVRFGTNPVGFVASIISIYVVNTVLNLGAFGVNVVLAGGDILVGIFDFARVVLIWAFGGVGRDILAGVLIVREAVADVVGSAGPAGPIIAAVVVSVGLYGLYRLAVAGLGELPLGSSIVDLLGLR